MSLSIFEGFALYKHVPKEYFSILPPESKTLDLSTAKEKYIAFIQENYVPLFFRDYYLDAVSEGAWDVVLHQENDTITAAYIYMIKQKMAIKYIVQPKLCPYTGPVFFNPSDAHKAYSALLQQLPYHQLIIQDYFPGIPNFKNTPHNETKKHTYLIDKSVDLDSLWGHQSSTHRRIIRKAEKELRHEEVSDIDAFLQFVADTFRKRNKPLPNDPAVFQVLDETLRQKGLRKIVKCTDKNDDVVAMCYFMNDELWTYNFANGVVEDYRHYGMNLILWNEIKSTLSEGRSFDFEGSMIPGVDEFFKRFKGTKTQYQSRVKSTNKLVDLLVKIKTSKSFK